MLKPHCYYVLRLKLFASNVYVEKGFGSELTIHYHLVMKTPAPIRLTHHFLDNLRFPALAAGSVVFAVFFILFYVLGTIFVPNSYLIFESDPERNGFYIISSIIPSYFTICFIAGTRLLESNYPLMKRELELQVANDIFEKKNSIGQWWPLMIIAGCALSSFNMYWPDMVFDPQVPGFGDSIYVLVGNVIIWTSITLVMFFFLLEGRLYHQAGKRVDIQLYDLNKLNGFGRASLGGFLLVMGGLTLSTIQSIDAEFSWGRYRQAVLIGVPSAIILTLLPSWSLHRRIRKSKRIHLEEINQQIAQTSNSLAPEDLERMNSLLTRRSIVSGFRTWPMDFSIVSRFVLYVFIPPLAWIGAALMEVLLDSYLAG